MRAIVLALIMFASASAAAQPPPPPRQTSHPAPPPPTLPPAVVAPPLTFPFPPLMRPPAGGLTPRAGEGTPFHTSTPLFNPSGSPVFYTPFMFGYSAPEEPVARKRAARSPAAPATGLLRLAVTPGSAQVFVDSYYVGTVDDVNAQHVLQLEAGPHRIEFRAAQYQTLTVDVRILPYDTVTYRGALELTRAAAPAAPAPAALPTTMYVIPNCYLGNVPPRPSRLPAGCDIKRVEIFAPR